jgi:hypothetical protein
METVKSKQSVSSAGKSQAESQDILQPSFTLKGSCSELTVGEYIRILCHDEYRRLILSGTPSDRDLRQAFASILQEYAFLSGHDNAGGMFTDWNTMVSLRASIIRATIAANILVFDQKLAIEVLSHTSMSNIEALEDMDENKCLQLIKNYIDMLSVRAEEAVIKASKKAKKSEGKKITEKDIRLEMAIIGGDGIIPDDCSLALYAGKVNAYRLKQDALKKAAKETKRR